LANAAEADRDQRIAIELINLPFLRAGASADEYGRHRSGDRKWLVGETRIRNLCEVHAGWRGPVRLMASGCGGARLLRQPKLLLQFFHQLLEALCRDGVIAQGSRTLGLFQPPLKFFAVALFSHGDTLLSM
jgi:hypothetical protein